MDPLELSYDNISAVPEAFRGLYEEKEGKAVLTKINGLKTQADINNISEALRKEREDHKAAKSLLAPWQNFGKKPEEIQAQLDRIAELEAAGGGKIDEAKLSQLVEARLGQKTAPLERQLRELTTNYETATRERDEARSIISRREMSDAVRAVAGEMKVLGTAIPDVELFAQMALERQEDGSYITKQGISGVTPGVDVKTMLKDLQKIRPHWWPASEGGGAGGSGGGRDGDNPWSAGGWSLTKQGEYIKAHGLAAAQAAAKSVGSAVGATKPPAKK